MNRRLLLLLSVGTIAVLPTPAMAQSVDQKLPDAENSGAVEAEVFMSALGYIQKLHMQSYSDSTLWARALDGLIEELGDPYAAVFTPREVEEFEEETSGNYAGIGVTISQLNDRVTVTGVFRGAPASEAGLQVGDVIVAVGENDATAWTTAIASDSIRGPAGTAVDVRIRREGVREPLAFTMNRDSVHVSAVQASVLPGNIGYLSLDRVARSSAQEVAEALDSLGGTRGIVFDLRRNPGGYLDESLNMADIFLDRGAVLASTRNRSSRSPGMTSEEKYRGRMRPRVPNTPIIILVDRYTASAAEIVTGALQDYDRALVIGERTFGKGIVQSVVELPYGRKLRITTGSWHTPLGRSLHRERDMSGDPLPEKLDTISEVMTPSGRPLLAGGGIFPDLAIAPDTLTLLERELLSAASEKRLPIGVREAEASFARAKALREAGEPPSVDEATVDGLLAVLAETGIDADLLAEPEIRDYLRWRLAVGVADRMDDLSAVTLVRMERDHALTQAVDLLRGVETQGELFASVAERMKAGDASASSAVRGGNER